MEKKEVPSKGNKKEYQNPIDLEDLLLKLNRYICSAQRDLYTQSIKIIEQLYDTKVMLPTAYLQTINEKGEMELKRISSTITPLGSMLNAGVFEIDDVDIDFPVPIESVSPYKNMALDISKAHEKEGSTEHLVLKISYQYKALNLPDSKPLIIRNEPVIDIQFKEFKIDPDNGKRCIALGILSAHNVETGKPMSKAKVYLNVEHGTILPVESNLDDKGEIEFRIQASCNENRELNTKLNLVVNGFARSLGISLSADMR